MVMDGWNNKKYSRDDLPWKQETIWDMSEII